MACAYCGAEAASPESRFCVACGASLLLEESTTEDGVAWSPPSPSSPRLGWAREAAARPLLAAGAIALATLLVVVVFEVTTDQGEGKQSVAVADQLESASTLQPLPTTVGAAALTGPATASSSIPSAAGLTAPTTSGSTGSVVSHSGKAFVPAGKASVTVSGVTLGASSLVLATLQQRAGSISVAAAIPNAAASSFKIVLSQVATSNLAVAWLIVG
jgi:hypothetical protein